MSYKSTIDVSKLHVITPITNPYRYESRYRLYHDFKQHMEDAGINLWTVEVAFGDRPWEVTAPGDARALQLRHKSALWTKENSINLMVERLPSDWQYICWIDGDIQFPTWRGDHAWYKEAVEAMQHHRVVQLFENAIDLGPHGETIALHKGFAAQYVRGELKVDSYYGGSGHPGFAWGMRRDVWDATGGLLDFAILGAADRHMAYAWIGRVRDSANGGMSRQYFDRLEAYQGLCEHFVKRDLGFVRGTILHGFHGAKKKRQYASRWKILVDNKYDPNTDVARDWQGLLHLSDLGDARHNTLRDQIRGYFTSRDEDGRDPAG